MFLVDVLLRVAAEHLLLLVDESRAVEHLVPVQAVVLAQAEHFRHVSSLFNVCARVHRGAVRAIQAVVVSRSSLLFPRLVRVVLLRAVEHDQSNSFDEQNKRLLSHAQRVEQRQRV